MCPGGPTQGSPSHLDIKGPFEVLERFHWRGYDRQGFFYNEGIFAASERSRMVRGARILFCVFGGSNDGRPESLPGL